MGANDNIRWILGGIIVLFIIAAGSILLFGLTNTAGGISLSLFKTMFFALILGALGFIYMLSMHRLKTKMEHVIAVASILSLAISSSAFAGGVKGNLDASTGKGLVQLETAGPDYNQIALSMADQENSINATNAILEQEIANVSAQLDNRKPIVVETVKEIPGEIITVQDPPVQVVQPTPQPVAQPIQQPPRTRWHEREGGYDD